jgi:hypothetical protein
MAQDVFINVENLTFYGLKEGLLQNNSYFAQLNNLYFKFCDRGWFTYQSHACTINNMQAGFCNKAYEVRSSELSVTNMGTSFCPISLHVGAGSNLFNGTYFESNNCGEAQIIVGDNPGDKYYVPGYSYYVDAVVMNVTTVVANKIDKTPGMALIMKENARRLYFNGGSIQSSNKQYTNANNKVYSQGMLGMTNTANSTVIN